MENITLPKKVSFKEGSNLHEGIVTVEPLFPGYGMTLGNSLRRVLLSSLPGAAVIGVKVKGASHEFMTLPNIKEDVLEIVLNLKQLRFKIFTDEEVRLELKAKGKKVIVAGDITKDSQVEIVNKDLVIAQITDSSGSLDLEIIVKEGRGYKMIDGAKKENKELGYIEIDSIFTPVLLVSVNVNNTRVGKMTNWDKITLNIKTDGTISPEEAFNQTVKILVDQLKALIPKEKIVDGEIVELESETGKKAQKKMVSADKAKGETKKKSKK